MSAPLRVAVVGLGYWGPNLLRNLVELDEAEVVIDVRRARGAARALGRRYPAVETTTSYLEVLSDDRRRRGRDRDAGLDALRAGLEGAAVRQARVRREAARGELGGGGGARAARPQGRPRADARPHVPLQPAGRAHQGADRPGDLGEIYFISSSRVNLGLHQPDVSVVWDLGPHDFSILRYWLGESPSTVSAMSRDCVIPGTPDVAFINLAVRLGHRRPGRAGVARAEQAAPHGGRRLGADGRVRRHERRAGAGLRLGRDAPRPGDVRRVPAQLPHGRHRLAARRAGRAAAAGRWRTSAGPSASGSSRARRRRSAARSWR